MLGDYFDYETATQFLPKHVAGWDSMPALAVLTVLVGVCIWANVRR